MYASNNNKVAIVDSSGTVIAKSVGTAVITAFIDRAEPARIEINVKKAPSKVQLAVPVNKRIKKGNTFKIASSNKKIAKVNKNGKVTALKKGKTIITVKTYNNKKATIKLTVN